MTKSIFSVLALCLAGGIFFFYTKPSYDDTQGIQAEIGEYSAALDKAAELQELKQGLLSRYNSFSPSDLDRLHKLLPDHVDNVALILDLDNLAARFGLALQNVDVSTPARASSQNGITAPGASARKYDSITIKFATTGTYARFLEFLRELESSLRVVDLVSLGLTPQSGSAAAANGEPLYRYDITLRTYWLK